MSHILENFGISALGTGVGCGGLKILNAGLNANGIQLYR